MPLHELTKSDVAYDWNTQRQAAFNFLKQALISASMLATSQDDGVFVLDVDASDLAVGTVLQQMQGDILRVIGYASRTFITCERKYCITQKELAAVEKHGYVVKWHGIEKRRQTQSVFLHAKTTGKHD